MAMRAKYRKTYSEPNNVYDASKRASSSSSSSSNGIRSILETTLVLDSSDWAYVNVYRFMLALQWCYYTWALIRLYKNPFFSYLGDFIDPYTNQTFHPKEWHQLRENHLYNISILKSDPDPLILGAHMLMAWIWVTVIMLQKVIINKMAKALVGARKGEEGERYHYTLYRSIHIVIGTAMCFVAVVGCVCGGIIAYRHHDHWKMRYFLLSLPWFFIPPVIAVYVYGRKSDIPQHRLWASIVFLGPALSSLWAEGWIWLLGRHSSLGPWNGELVGTSLGAIMLLVFVAYPAYKFKKYVHDIVYYANNIDVFVDGKSKKDDDDDDHHHHHHQIENNHEHQLPSSVS